MTQNIYQVVLRGTSHVLYETTVIEYAAVALAATADKLGGHFHLQRTTSRDQWNGIKPVPLERPSLCLPSFEEVERILDMTEVNCLG